MKKSSRPWWWKYLFAATRRVFRWSPERKACIKFDPEQGCAKCKKKVRDYQIDHVSPVVPTNTPFNGDWNVYFERMFYGELQRLCEKCHKLKTKQEAKERKESRAQRKKDAQVTEKDLDAFADTFVE